ncbi:LacI family DNA-binding transcriptional regulator [Anaeromicropila populeti]|uniref:Transcriptional regulator, LacI family n=1 Tax=Anaeromicropila populeti TaxID=37658 RepID=A0A1I6JRD0_9FIRM|nr:LacI family DNA-binding transcriptional regulator [Anaeromicropila populeti]SFR81534.1 transcriptional regulator, LacI family [Anaeromicropila populeti]
MENKMSDRTNTTIGDVAEALGVSKTTVSRAISGKGRISPATRNKVLEYIEKHNFKPNTIAKGLAQSKTFNICVTIPVECGVTEQVFFQTVLVGMCNYLSARDYDVVVADIAENDISNLERIISNRKVDGVIVTRTLIDGNIVEYLKATKIPFVTLGLYPDDEVVQIDANHTEGCGELVSFLLMRGFRRLALLGGNTKHIVTESRYRGFENAHKQAGLAVDRTLVYENMINDVVIEKAIDDILKKKADCILCMDDNICNTVLHKFNKEGIRIPEDIKIASFFNSILLENNHPSISCVDFDTTEEGMLAGKLILDLLDGEEVPTVTRLGYQVILKDSTK